MSSPWKPPATTKRFFTAIVLIWVSVRPSNKFPAHFSVGTIRPEKLRTSERLREIDDQCISESFEIKYTSCFEVAHTKFLSRQNRKSCSFGNCQMSQNHNHILHIGSHSQEELPFKKRSRFLHPAEEIALATPEIASATPALEIAVLLLIWRLLRSSSNRNCSATATPEIDTAPEIDTLLLNWRLLSSSSSGNGSSSTGNGSAPPKIEGHPEIEEGPLAREEAPLAPAPPEIEGGYEFVLVVQKNLTRSDVRKDRLTLPIKQSNYNFLRESEIAQLDANGSLEVVMRSLETHDTTDMCIKQHRDGGSSNKVTRVLTSGWKNYGDQRNLQFNDLIQLWKFRKDGNLCFFVRKEGEQ